MTEPTKEVLNEIKIIPKLDTIKLLKIDDEEYFSSKYKYFVSNSRLGLINPEQDGSPEKFFTGDYGSTTKSLNIGSVVHALCLQPELFDLAYTVYKPSAKMGEMADVLYDLMEKKSTITDEDIINASNIVDYYSGSMTQKRIDKVFADCSLYFEYKNEFEKNNNNGKTHLYLDASSIEKVSGCMMSIKENNMIQLLLHPKGLFETPICENEQAIIMEFELRVPYKKPFVFPFKAKLDNYTIDHEEKLLVVNDLKTIGKDTREFPESITTYHYNREIWIYMYLLYLTGNYSDYRKLANFLVVSTRAPYYSEIYPVLEADLFSGMDEFYYLMKLAAWYYSEGYTFE